MNTISRAQEKLSEEGKYFCFLRCSSEYHSRTFEDFLEYYSFKISEDTIIVFNNDSMPYQDYPNTDFSYVPAVLLSFSGEKIKKWIEEETEKHLKQQEKNKSLEKHRVEFEIERLQKQLREYE